MSNIFEQDHQQALLVGVDCHNDPPNFSHEMSELKQLATACLIDTCGITTQHRPKPHAQFFVGSGKLQEIKQLLEMHQADCVIFNTELSPSQLRNIEQVLECTVIDRTLLILEIFERRAHTKESQIQVEIAKLQYLLPRLVGMRASLGRQSGGVGTKNKGLGEKKIDLDRRKIEQQITVLKHELQHVVAVRQTQRKWRKKQNMPTIALVGYTNSGKSTLMNVFMQQYAPTSAHVLEQDMLFATLETTSRRIDVDHLNSFILTDTVGFITNLPHHLVDAFKSTLEEITEADLLLHVVDLNDTNYPTMMQVTLDTLKQLGVDHIPIITVYNKIDLMTDHVLLDSDDLVCYISAAKTLGIDVLTNTITKQLTQNFLECTLLIPYSEAHITAFYHKHAQILEEIFTDEGTQLTVIADIPAIHKFKNFVISPL